MKSCPTCNRTFEDTFTFCLVDGSILSAPSDPQATLVLPINQTENIPSTEASPPITPIMPIQEATITSVPLGVGPGYENSHRQELRPKPKAWLSLSKIVVGTIVGVLFGVSFFLLSSVIQYSELLSHLGTYVATCGAIMGLLQGFLNSLIWTGANKFFPSKASAMAAGGLIGVGVSLMCWVGLYLPVNNLYIADAFSILYTNFGAGLYAGTGVYGSARLIHVTLFGLLLGTILGIVYRFKTLSRLSGVV